MCLALRPGYGTRRRLPFGRWPSLQSLRPTCGWFVRDLLRYYAIVRLPEFVHLERVSLDFLLRPVRFSCLTGKLRLSRLPREMFLCMYGVFALAEPDGLSRVSSPSVWPSVLSQHVGAPSLVFRGSIPDLHMPLSTLHSANYLSQCMTRGPVWFATPSLHRTCTYPISPVCAGARDTTRRKPLFLPRRSGLP